MKRNKQKTKNSQKRGFVNFIKNFLNLSKESRKYKGKKQNNEYQEDFCMNLSDSNIKTELNEKNLQLRENQILYFNPTNSNFDNGRHHSQVSSINSTVSNGNLENFTRESIDENHSKFCIEGNQTALKSDSKNTLYSIKHALPKRNSSSLTSSLEFLQKQSFENRSKIYLEKTREQSSDTLSECVCQAKQSSTNMDGISTITNSDKHIVKKDLNNMTRQELLEDLITVLMKILIEEKGNEKVHKVKHAISNDGKANNESNIDRNEYISNRKDKRYSPVVDNFENLHTIKENKKINKAKEYIEVNESEWNNLIVDDFNDRNIKSKHLTPFSDNAKHLHEAQVIKNKQKLIYNIPDVTNQHHQRDKNEKMVAKKEKNIFSCGYSGEEAWNNEETKEMNNLTSDMGDILTVTPEKVHSLTNDLNDKMKSDLITNHSEYIVNSQYQYQLSKHLDDKNVNFPDFRDDNKKVANKTENLMLSSPTDIRFIEIGSEKITLSSENKPKLEQFVPMKEKSKCLYTAENFLLPITKEEMQQNVFMEASEYNWRDKKSIENDNKILNPSSLHQKSKGNTLEGSGWNNIEEKVIERSPPTISDPPIIRYLPTNLQGKKYGDTENNDLQHIKIIPTILQNSKLNFIQIEICIHFNSNKSEAVIPIAVVTPSYFDHISVISEHQSWKSIEVSMSESLKPTALYNNAKHRSLSMCSQDLFQHVSKMEQVIKRATLLIAEPREKLNNKDINKNIKQKNLHITKVASRKGMKIIKYCHQNKIQEEPYFVLSTPAKHGKYSSVDRRKIQSHKISAPEKMGKGLYGDILVQNLPKTMENNNALLDNKGNEYKLQASEVSVIVETPLKHKVTKSLEDCRRNKSFGVLKASINVDRNKDKEGNNSERSIENTSKNNALEENGAAPKMNLKKYK
ncbi:repetitive organellar protein-like [Centruroides vittatus]|uniref:repetitive organellar protein-like n=1 Tax=Centruroides vittatus TaxID=120091 RepID=UPI00350F82F1